MGKKYLKLEMDNERVGGGGRQKKNCVGIITKRNRLLYEEWNNHETQSKSVITPSET